jgi:hypothetical protein
VAPPKQRHAAGERATGIEPALEAWKASVQPQHFARECLQLSLDPPIWVLGGWASWPGVGCGGLSAGGAS